MSCELKFKMHACRQWAALSGTGSTHLETVGPVQFGGALLARVSLEQDTP